MRLFSDRCSTTFMISCRTIGELDFTIPTVKAHVYLCESKICDGIVAFSLHSLILLIIVYHILYCACTGNCITKRNSEGDY